MAMQPLTMPKPIKAPGLFDAAAAGGATFDHWNSANGATSPMPSIAPAQINDSMADKVTAITSEDSKINQMARTEGLKSANARGMLNSSMAAGASMDAVIRNALPIASQDAAQDFARNQDARQFEYGMVGQNDAQNFQRDQATLDRDLQIKVQTNALTAAEAAQIKDITSREGMAAGDRAFQGAMQAADRALQSQIANWNLASSDRNAAANFITNTQSMFESQTRAIMANTALDATQRTAQLASAKALHDKQLLVVEALYNVNIGWFPPPAAPAPAPTGTPAPNPTTPPTPTTYPNFGGGLTWNTAWGPKPSWWRGWPTTTPTPSRYQFGGNR